MAEAEWIDLGSVETLRTKSVQQVMARRTRIAMIYKDDQFSAISGVCNLMSCHHVLSQSRYLFWRTQL